jgi:hypothetical protein
VGLIVLGNKVTKSQAFEVIFRTQIGLEVFISEDKMRNFIYSKILEKEGGAQQGRYCH